MVGIVLISHSGRLVDGLRDLLTELSKGDVAVEVAGGTVDGGLGTSEELILAAISRADDGDGVLLLADIGSSVLTALTILDDLDRADLRLADAPLVEGGVAAVVTASTGATLDTVTAAAEEARTVGKLP
ncbi:dihydroxyacetone kinase phosphoryl donor subunit DhaM [Catenuloplanes atrovinosus]|uniref:phosphoenolpyruvate--glycerone phosphotransferase n=1 Tax=Catenuloplanes atrovinosus TaxID=137266 RepID=A0AAE4C7T9_9ACTN|nr:dihydroxyacetone kinase phosphoryl donor subunit DhaM [Catenuloplanes atrovinosus]MDR7274856.1 dihydroxyacetone kinase phosphotransfer subunit [Catenuloplanes atrovinosus]